MWLLPQVVRGNSHWHLPLCQHSAARLVLALLEVNPHQQSGRLIEILHSDVSLAIWTALQCSTSFSPSQDGSQIARVFARLVSGQFAELRDAKSIFVADFPSRQQRWSVLAATIDAQVLAEQSGRSISGYLRHAQAWLESCQIDASGERPSLDFPRLVDWSIQDSLSSDADFPNAESQGSGERQGASRRCCVNESDVSQWWVAPQETDVELSRLLPSVVVRLRRLEQLESEFSKALEQEKLESLRQFAYGAGHEINNPLANIATRGQALLREEQDAERRRKLSTLVSQAFRAHEMISDLMLFARPPTPALAEFDVAEMLREAIAEIRTEAQQQNTNPQLSAATGILLHGDRRQLIVAIKALLQNSLEALGNGGEIDVRLRHVNEAMAADSETTRGAATRFDSLGSLVEITVRDSGPGIPSAVRRHMFDPFYSGRESGRGLGFGLSKCWRIIQMHRGTIAVNEVAGSGTAITVCLPAVAAMVKQEH